MNEAPTGRPVRGPTPAETVTTGKRVKFYVALNAIRKSPSPPKWPKS